MSASLINNGLSLNNLKRFWPLWLSFAVAWFLGLILPIALIVPASGEAAAEIMNTGWTIEYFASLCGCAFAALVSVCFVFEYLFKQSSAMFHGALPVKRSSLFVSTYVSGLLPLIAIEIVVAIILLFFTVVFPGLEAVDAWIWLALTAGFTFIFYSLAAFCAVLTGTRPMAISLYVLANFFIIFVEGFLRVISSVTMWGVYGFDAFRTLWTSPAVGLARYTLAAGTGAYATASSIDFVSLIAYVVVAVVLVVLAIMLNKRRNLESAGNTTAFSAVRVVCKYITGVVGALFCAFLVLLFMEISNDGIYGLLSGGQIACVTIFMMIGGFLGLFFGEVALSKSVRVGKKCVKGTAVLAVLSLVFMAGCCMDVLNIVHYIPKASEVKSVELNNGIVLEQEENIEKVIASHQAVLDYGVSKYQSSGYSNVMDFTYTLNSGKVVRRSYAVCYQTDGSDPNTVIPEAKQMIEDYDALLNCREGIDSRYKKIVEAPEGSVNVRIWTEAEGDTYLNVTDIDEFINGPLMNDVHEYGLGSIETVSDYSGSNAYVENCPTIGIDYMHNGASDYFSFELTKGNCPNVAKWLKEHYKIDVLK